MGAAVSRVGAGGGWRQGDVGSQDVARARWRSTGGGSLSALSQAKVSGHGRLPRCPSGPWGLLALTGRPREGSRSASLNRRAGQHGPRASGHLWGFWGPSLTCAGGPWFVRPGPVSAARLHGPGPAPGAEFVRPGPAPGASLGAPSDTMVLLGKWATLAQRVRRPASVIRSGQGRGRTTAFLHRPISGPQPNNRMTCRSRTQESVRARRRSPWVRLCWRPRRCAGAPAMLLGAPWGLFESS
jgi:hypothetical protein